MSLPPVELRSDTFTRPTESMRRAMYAAEVGDDVWGEDPTVARLEEMAARITGKEAALFVSSGTQGNLVGVLSHARHGDEVIVGDEAHFFLNEVAGAAVVGGLQLRQLPNGSGSLDPEQVGTAIRGRDVHFPYTGCVALENTHNRCGGTVATREAMAEIAEVAHAAGVPVHLDGARIFNAVIALGTSPAVLLEPVDSVTFCLSKALGAPIGSVLCGKAEYIDRARRWRKLLGGGMRQVGILAAAGLVALTENVERLAEDHANARALADGLASIPGIELDPTKVQSNIVYFDIGGTGLSYDRFRFEMEDRGVRLSGYGTSIRAVASYEVNRSGIDRALRAAAEVARASTPALA